MEEDRKSIRCCVAKVVQIRHSGPNGSEEHAGTKHLRGGAKVYVIDAHWGSCSRVTIIGHHRRGGQFFKLTMQAKDLEDYKVQYVYSPTVIEMIEEHYSSFASHPGANYADEIADAVPKWGVG